MMSNSSLFHCISEYNWAKKIWSCLFWTISCLIKKIFAKLSCLPYHFLRLSYISYTVLAMCINCSLIFIFLKCKSQYSIMLSSTSHFFSLIVVISLGLIALTYPNLSFSLSEILSTSMLAYGFFLILPALLQVVALYRPVWGSLQWMLVFIGYYGYMMI
jgi:hypothetical protein